MPSSAQVYAAAKRIQGSAPDAPDNVVSQLLFNFTSRFLLTNPLDTNILLEPEPRRGYGIVTCNDCQERIRLDAPQNRLELGAATLEGIGSFQRYILHCDSINHRTRSHDRKRQEVVAGAQRLQLFHDVAAPRAPSGLNPIQGAPRLAAPAAIRAKLPKPQLKRASSDSDSDAPKAKRLDQTASPNRKPLQNMGSNRAASNLAPVASSSKVPANTITSIDSDDDQELPLPDMEGIINAAGIEALTGQHQEFLRIATEAAQFEGSERVDDARKELGIPLLGRAQLEGFSDELVLMPHQIISVAWMQRQEKSKNMKGGILADEMGLGKTISSIGVMVKNPPTQAALDAGKKVATLILAPLALLQQWKEEIEDKTDDLFDVLIYHGSGKVKTLKKLQDYNVILTTHQTLALEWSPDDALARAQAKSKAKKAGREWDEEEEEDWTPAKKSGILFDMQYHRVIIDEAHAIRNKNTRFSRAVTRIKTNYRWALTGTPIVNSLSDAFGLFRFLRISPWYDWSEFSKHISGYEKRRPDYAAKKCLGILQTIMMRRTKESKLDGKPLIQLPEKTVETVQLDLSPEERQIYEAVQTNAQITFCKFLKAGTVLKNYAHVLVLLLRLRQICSHPALIAEDPLGTALLEADEIAFKKERERAVTMIGANQVDKILKRYLANALDAMQKEKNGEEMDPEECAICYEAFSLEDDRLTACGHAYCKGCLEGHLSAPLPENAHAEEGRELREGERYCPECREVISEDRTFNFAAFRPTDEEIEEAQGKDDEDEDQVDEDVEMTDKKGKKSKNDPVSLISSDEDDELPDINVKGKAKGKKIASSSDNDEEAIRPKKRDFSRKKAPKKRIAASDDSDLDDFIVEDDEDPEARGPRKPRSSKRDMEESEDEDGSGSQAEESDDEGSDEEAKKRKAKKLYKDLTKGKGKADMQKKVVPTAKFLVSTKMRAMMDEIKRVAVETADDDKTIVFSQWTGCLDLIDTFMVQEDICFVRFQGDMTRKERDRAVKAFMRNKKVKIMRAFIFLADMTKNPVMSLKSGGVGLNLTRSNRVICLDLAWSPATEEQAFARVHRLGQTKEVSIKRLVIRNSVEDRLLEIQARKGHLMAGAMGEKTNSKGKANKKLTVADLARLFGLNAAGGIDEDE